MREGSWSDFFLRRLNSKFVSRFVHTALSPYFTKTNDISQQWVAGESKSVQLEAHTNLVCP
jgi:hypothetical protein